MNFWKCLSRSHGDTGNRNNTNYYGVSDLEVDRAVPGVIFRNANRDEDIAIHLHVAASSPPFGMQNSRRRGRRRYIMLRAAEASCPC